MFIQKRPVISVGELDRNFPSKLLDKLKRRFYHAKQEFGKLKNRQAELDRKRGHVCPWGRKLSEDAWIRRVRKQWQEQPPTIPEVRRGRPGFVFETLLKIWAYAPFFKAEQNAEDIANTLDINPEFARLCGLPSETTPAGKAVYEIPAARTLRHFNQILYTFDLWGDFKRFLILDNLEKNVIQWSENLVIDPTHLDAFARVRKSCTACRICPKRDRCHFAQNTCELTGIVSKSDNYKLPGVKLNFALLPECQIAIEAIACRGQAHDSKLLNPVLVKLATDYPDLKDRVKKVLADGAYDFDFCHQVTRETMQAELITPINPGNRKPIENPARGIMQITPYGVPVCIAGHEMILTGRDCQKEQFIWVCPVFNEQRGDLNLPCSDACKRRCCPDAGQGRAYRVDRDFTPGINWDNPQHLASTIRLYNLRTSVERAISGAKRILKFDRFYNRGRMALQAHGDRYVIAVQLVAHVAGKLHRPEAARRYRLTGS